MFFEDWNQRLNEKRRFKTIFVWVYLFIISIGLFAMAILSRAENRQLSVFFVLCGVIMLVLTIISLRAHINYARNYIALNGNEPIKDTIKMSAIILAISAAVIVVVFAVATVINRMAI